MSNFSVPTESREQPIVTLIIGFVVGFTFIFYWLPHPFLEHAHTSNDMSAVSGPAKHLVYHNPEGEFHKQEDNTVAKDLARKVRVLCWVMTGPRTHNKKARHVKNTWAKRCNKILFMSSVADPDLPTIRLPVREGRDNLWPKTKSAFRYIYRHHFTHMSGGAGYVLSKEGLRRFAKLALKNKTICSPSNSGYEDVEMGKCMEGVGVEAGDTRDSLGRGKFFPFVPEHHLIPGHTPKSFWYWNYVYYETTEGMECSSDNAVSFHYVRPNQMYILEYLIYHLRPYGINYKVNPPGRDRKNTSLNDVDDRKPVDHQTLDLRLC